MILFHDIDGCLNGSDGKSLGFCDDDLSSEHRRELSELGQLLDESDIEHFVLNTGRSWADTEYLGRAIGSRKSRFALVEHGAALWDMQTRMQVNLELIVLKHDLGHFESALKSLHRVAALIDWYEVEGHEHLAESLGYGGVLLSGTANQAANLTFKVPSDLDGDTVLASLKRVVSAQEMFKNDHFVYHYGSEGFVDVVGVMDKGIGVDLSIKYLDGDSKNSIAVGNGANDMAMLRKVYIPFCPANAESLVKSFCGEHGIVSDHSFITATTSWLKSRSR